MVAKKKPLRNEFTAVVQRDGPWFVATCPEVPGANGQGRTRRGALQSLRGAILLILKDRRNDGLRDVPPEALLETIVVR